MANGQCDYLLLISFDVAPECHLEGSEFAFKSPPLSVGDYQASTGCDFLRALAAVDQKQYGHADGDAVGHLLQDQ
jgi:hypothetical protein